MSNKAHNSINNDKIDRSELISKLKQCRIVDDTKRIIIKELDYSNNPISPVNTAYRISYTDILGKKCKTVYFGETVGFQG